MSGVLGISDKTCKKYTDYLRQAFLIQILTKHSFKSKNRIRSQKAYIVDLGFQNNRENSMAGENVGWRLENVVYIELLRRCAYDFRDVYISPSNTVYVISRNGFLYIKNGKDVKLLEVPLVRPFKMQLCLDERYQLLIGENNMAKLDQTTNTIVATKDLNFKVVMTARLEHMPVLFDDKGRMHIVKDLNKIETKKIPVSGQVTAFATSNSSGLQAYGMKDGTIYLYDAKGNVRKLVGHRSRVSRIRINENRLFSSSYDGTINLWIANTEKVEPITLFSSNNWILYFNYDRSKNYLWLGDQKGNLSQVLISVPIMVDRIKHKLKRDFTQTEWNYYIGENIPYESFLSKKGKEAKR